jgi:hypothetical protein
MTYKLKRRRFCVITKGYIGLFANRNKNWRRDCSFWRCYSVLCVTQAGKGDMAFYLIGKCYVYGIMRGEAFDETTETKDISLR